MRALALLLLPLALPAQNRPTIALETPAARVVVEILGGSITAFTRAGDELDPIVWNESGPTDEARPMGHFLCFDRWGQPSAAEAERGMMFHGEATRQRWAIDRKPAQADGAITAEMSASLPIAGLSIRRTMRLGESAAVLEVVETVTNDNRLGRIYNLVQHPTIGGPFLDETTEVDANVRKGFMQSSPWPNPEEPAVYWPYALSQGRPVDLRRLTDDHDPNVVSFVVHEPVGWVAAFHRQKGLLLGYLWSRDDYPWLNLWRSAPDGRPLARGLEFGTTGLHQPFDRLVEKHRIFERPLYDYLDAGESRSLRYLAFLAEIPADFQAVAAIEAEDGSIRIRESGPEGRTIELPLGPIPGF